MAAVDALLRALLKHQMDALVLSPGRRPRLQKGDQEHAVTKSRLDAATLAQILAEIAPPSANARAGADLSFEYPLDGTTFRFQARGDESAWTVTATRSGAEAAAAAAGAAPAAAAQTAAPPAAPASRPITAIVELLELLVERGGSDLHLTVSQRPRMRLDGELVELEAYDPPPHDELERLLFEITPPRGREQFEESHDADFAYALPGRARFRVNLFRNRHGIAAVFRQIPHQVPGFADLGLPAHLRRLADLSKGLVLVTGPTGSGKSTTLAAIVDLINRQRRDHIITIEDPIEFVHPSKGCLVNQREVGVHTSSFKRALRAALREDPDIVLVGEMRDLETIAIAIETAETGHLVFGTLHTTTAPSTIERVVDQFPGDRQEQIRIMLADSLRAVIAQTLLKKTGGGRVAAFEILICTPAVSNLIREGKTFQIPSAMQTGKRQGMCQMTDSIFELVERKLVEPAEAYLKAIEKDTLLSKFKAAGIAFEPGGEKTDPAGG